MKIDLKKAREILESEINEARLLKAQGPWVDRVRALSAALNKKAQTYPAVLGTALLTKATHIEIDPFSLKASSGPNGYSARNVCKQVLAAEAARLGIDLGVTSREPLNNQPFFGKSRISAEMTVHTTARPAFDILLDCIGALAKVKTAKEAREALRAFLQLRVKAPSSIVIEDDEGDVLDANELLSLIERFVAEDSESGKRAQAVAAGLMDTKYGDTRVRVGRIHDPGRRFSDMSGLESVMQMAAQKAQGYSLSVNSVILGITDLMISILSFLSYLLLYVARYLMVALYHFSWVFLLLISPIVLLFHVFSPRITLNLFRSLIEVASWNIVWAVLSAMLTALPFGNAYMADGNYLVVIVLNVIIALAMLGTPLVVRSIIGSGFSAMASSLGPAVVTTMVMAPAKAASMTNVAREVLTNTTGYIKYQVGRAQNVSRPLAAMDPNYPFDKKVSKPAEQTSVPPPDSEPKKNK